MSVSDFCQVIKEIRADKKRARKARLAAEERRREEHARLVLQRTDDPRYVQGEVDSSSGDVILAISPEYPQASELASTLGLCGGDLVERFGREPGPDDPWPAIRALVASGPSSVGRGVSRRRRCRGSDRNLTRWCRPFSYHVWHARSVSALLR